MILCEMIRNDRKGRIRIRNKRSHGSATVPKRVKDSLSGVRVDLFDEPGDLLERGVHPRVNLNLVLRRCAYVAYKNNKKDQYIGKECLEG
jgi:hypothetical protein